MAKRKAKPPAPNHKPPFLPPWAWQMLVVLLGKSLGVVIFKLLGVLTLWAGLPWL